MSLFNKLKTQMDINDLKGPATNEEISEIEESLVFENLLNTMTPESHELLEMLVEKRNTEDFKPSTLVSSKGGLPSDDELASRGLFYGGTLGGALAFSGIAATINPAIAIPVFAGLAGGVIYYLIMKVIKSDKKLVGKVFPKYNKLLKLSENDTVSIELAKRIDDEIKLKNPDMKKLKLLRREFNDNLKYLLKYSKDEDVRRFNRELD
jgi:hypothetical protein